MTALQTLHDEPCEESFTTRRVLERVPADKLDWRPHAKSMTLVQLALHVAMIPGNIANLAQLEEFDGSQANFEPLSPREVQEIQAALEQSLKAAENIIGNMSEESASGNWQRTIKGNQVFTKQRLAVLLTLMMNHWYHHRGQLSVYLRLLDVPVPIIYGRSADENPFVQALSQRESMPHDEQLAKRIRRLLKGNHSVVERKMFGGITFMVNGHMCCGVSGSNLVVRVVQESFAASLNLPHARPMDLTGRQ